MKPLLVALLAAALGTVGCATTPPHEVLPVAYLDLTGKPPGYVPDNCVAPEVAECSLNNRDPIVNPNRPLNCYGPVLTKFRRALLTPAAAEEGFGVSVARSRPGLRLRGRHRGAAGDSSP